MAENQIEEIYNYIKRAARINHKKQSEVDVMFGGVVLIVIVIFYSTVTPLPYEGDIVKLSIKCILVIIAAYLLRKYVINKLKMEAENMILPPVMHSFDEVSTSYYNYEEGFDESHFTGSKMYNGRIDKFVSNILIRAIIGTDTGIQLAHIDANTGNMQNVNNAANNITIFSGMFSEIEFDKTFNFKIRLHTKNLSVDYRYFMGGRGYDIISSENKEFDDIYTVATTDKQQASYILTPEFMDTLIQFHNTYQTDIDLGFSHGMLYIAVHQLPDLLDITLANISHENLEKMHQFVKFQINIINILDSNPNIERIDEVVEVEA